MNALLIALTLSLAGAEGTVEGPRAMMEPAPFPLRMRLFDVEAEAPGVPTPSFTGLVVAFELPSYAELLGGSSLASSAVVDATETRPWPAARPARTEPSSLPWLKDWTQR